MQAAILRNRQKESAERGGEDRCRKRVRGEGQRYKDKKHSENAEKQYAEETTGSKKKKAARIHPNPTVQVGVPNAKKETSAHGMNKIHQICRMFDESHSENEEDEEAEEAGQEGRSASVVMNDRNVMSGVI